MAGPEHQSWVVRFDMKICDMPAMSVCTRVSYVCDPRTKLHRAGAIRALSSRLCPIMSVLCEYQHLSYGPSDPEPHCGPDTNTRTTLRETDAGGGSHLSWAMIKILKIYLVRCFRRNQVLEESVSTGEITQGLLMKAARQVLMISLFTSFK